MSRQIGRIVGLADGRHQPAGPFDDDNLAAPPPVIQPAPQQLRVDLFPLRLRRQMRCQRRGEPLWANGFQLAGPTGRFPQRHRIIRNQSPSYPPTAAGRRLIDTNLYSRPAQGRCDPRCDERFTDRRVSANDKQAGSRGLPDQSDLLARRHEAAI